jgi:citrate synthase
MTDTAKETPTAAAATGLRGVVVGASTVSDVVGDKGELIYQGYNIHDLAKRSTFEEVAFLLWNKRLPTTTELNELNQQLSSSYTLPAEVIELLRRSPRDSDPIDQLRTAVSHWNFTIRLRVISQLRTVERSQSS